jgi:6-phospho-beta-glucosidase
MKLAILGGGGARMPALVRALLRSETIKFGRVELFEPDALRRQSVGRLSVELAAAMGRPDVVSVTDDVESALTGADYVFSAIRVGGDAGRIIDEQVALELGLVGQETTGPGGCAMALRTIPVVLRHCDIISRVAPRATVVNFTNPAGLITQAICTQTAVPALGICDTPSEALRVIRDYLQVSDDRCSIGYGGLNHLGWITSVTVDGIEVMDRLLHDFDKLQVLGSSFGAFDPDLVRRVGAIPTEYLYYFYDSATYVSRITAAGLTRGEMVQTFNTGLVEEIMKSFETGGFHEAWAAYIDVMAARHSSYMRLDVLGESQRSDDTNAPEGSNLSGDAEAIGGYEGVALRVMGGLLGNTVEEVVVNTANGRSLSGFDEDHVVETTARIDTGGVSLLQTVDLPPAAQGLALQVKEYETAVVDAAVSGDAHLAATALAIHPLVPGATAAKKLLATYRERHGDHLGYLK